MQTTPTTYNFQPLTFKGNSKEYFKIWIVNIFLTIVTLGIYSAWAKVRTNRYFYANTYFKDSSFEYTADPIKILKGRLIIFALYLIFIVSGKLFLNPIVPLVIFVVGLLVVPWIMTKAIKFKLKNSRYKSINFKYHGTTWQMYKFVLLHLLLNIITVGLAYPYTLNSFKKFVINSSSYGSAKFSYEGKTGSMYMNFLKMLFLQFFVGLLVVVFFFFVSMIASFFNKNGLNINPNYFSQASILPLMMIYMISIFAYAVMAFGTKAIYDVVITNYVYSNTKLENYPIKSTMEVMKLLEIYTINILAIVISLGLLYPWTKVRTLKYKCENFFIGVDDEFVAKAIETSEQSALGEEAEEFFDFDIGV